MSCEYLYIFVNTDTNNRCQTANSCMWQRIKRERERERIVARIITSKAAFDRFEQRANVYCVHAAIRPLRLHCTLATMAITSILANINTASAYARCSAHEHHHQINNNNKYFLSIVLHCFLLGSNSVISIRVSHRAGCMCDETRYYDYNKWYTYYQCVATGYTWVRFFLLYKGMRWHNSNIRVCARC